MTLPFCWLRSVVTFLFWFHCIYICFLSAHPSSQNSRVLTISTRLLLPLSNDKVKDWKLCECRGYGVWEGYLDENQSTVMGTQCKSLTLFLWFTAFPWFRWIWRSSVFYIGPSDPLKLWEGSEPKKKCKGVKKGVKGVKKHPVVLSEIRNGQFDPVQEIKKKIRRKAVSK